ncbi:Uncharacterised protein [Klebsiella aerogenes]|uniref:hypothetical protein n=1 Tax=Klebsiella aerogenes TaxID=548 RepID=UPI00125AEAF1|nr:hypothetical protein [Klebsiella aerogenes]VAC93616.1 Uncharacterised protein [Klebsiella aerogenes]
MTDITRLITSLKRRSAHAKEFGHDVLFVKLEDIYALVEALEKAQETIAFQQGEIKALLSSLESHTVTVKLPEPFKLAKSSSGLTTTTPTRSMKR